MHPDTAIGTTRPFAFRPVVIQLDAVAVGIPQIDCFAHAMIRSAFERDAMFEHSTHGGGKGGTVGKENREMVQSGGPWGRRRRTAAGPRVQADVMV